MAGIGDRMSSANSTFEDADGNMFYADGTPVPPETARRLEYRARAWARREAGEDVSSDELFGPIPEDAV